MKLLLILGVLCVLAISDEKITNCVIKSCSGWRLNKYPRLREVLQRQLQDTYDNVVVEWVSGLNPTAYFYDSQGTELSHRELVDMDLQELMNIFDNSGFVPLRQNLVYPDIPTATNTFGGHQYELYKLQNYFGPALEFAQTRKHNNVHSGYLVTVTSQEENDFVTRFLSENGVASVWMGAKDDEEGKWKWISGPEDGVVFWSGGPDGQQVGSTYVQWNKGEPNNVDDEDCAVILASGLWNDAVCDKPKISLLVEFGTEPLQSTEKSDL